MEFRVAETVNHPQTLVYQTYRDELVSLVPYLPNVDAIERLEREATAAGVRHLYRWKVSGALPRAVRPFFSERMMTYLDHNSWDDEAMRVDWHFEIGVFPEAVDCRGSNHFTPGSQPGTTEVALTGRLQIDLARVRGVPRLLHGLGPKVERFILDQIRPNLAAVTLAVGRFLDERA
jgi:hypothetical protein